MADVVVPIVAALAALGGAGLGGWITFKVETTKAETQRRDKQLELKREILSDFFFQVAEWGLRCSHLPRSSVGETRNAAHAALAEFSAGSRRAGRQFELVCSEPLLTWLDESLLPALDRLFWAVETRLGEPVMEISDEADAFFAVLRQGRALLRMELDV
jgi:hypothetical protein